MEQIRTIVRKWGNSFGIVLPKKIVETEKIRDGLEVCITIHPAEKTKVRDIFGSLRLKTKKTTEQVMKEIDEDFWPEED